MPTADYRLVELPRRYARDTAGVSITETATEKHPSRVFRMCREGKGAYVSSQVYLAQGFRNEFDQQISSLVSNIRLVQGNRQLDQMGDRVMR